MANTLLAQVFGGSLDLIPHIEERAFRVLFRRFVMAQRSTVLTDMSGWNIRKWSTYLHSARAQELSEVTDIPENKIARTRHHQISIKEIGDRYILSDRRISTDLENIIAEVIRYMGYSLGTKVESDLYTKAMNSFTGGTLGDGTGTFSIAQLVQAQMEMEKQNLDRDMWYVVIHPYQALAVLEDLATFSGASAGRDTSGWRDASLQGLTVPAFGNINIVRGSLLPRNGMVWQYRNYGTGGTIRLEIGTNHVVGTDITAAITVSGTATTMASNIQTALNNLSGQSGWSVDGSGGNADIVITAPATSYFDAESELRIAIDQDNPTPPGYKSSYDLVTGLSGAPTDPNGDSLGGVVYEKSGKAKALFFNRRALVFDIRQGMQSFVDNKLYQGRAVEYAMNMKYGVERLQEEYGMFIYTDATSPTHVS